ncbi:hypothetical protein WJX73_010496 [Symbiochloris irregularis]|uniref:Profilin n=1 Tax=Symbiochloris irregularis TaxID=706552 RepID=A0AAW1P6K8_9CHLO
MVQDEHLASTAKKLLPDCSRILVFEENDNVLYSSFEADVRELETLKQTFTDRDEAIKAGLNLQGRRFEVHRYHPPLAYGRSMDTAPETSEGCAICQIDQGPSGDTAFAVITYEMPNISARMVSQLVLFCKESLGLKASISAQ